MLPTWHEWLESKGITPDTPLRHFKARGWLPDDKPKQLTPSGRYFITERNLSALIERIEGIEKALDVKANSALPGSWLRAEMKTIMNVICDLRPKQNKSKGDKND